MKMKMRNQCYRKVQVSTRRFLPVAPHNVSAIIHVLVLSPTSTTFIDAKIKPAPLNVIASKMSGLKRLDLKERIRSNRLTVNQTRCFVSLILTHEPLCEHPHFVVPFMPAVAFRRRQYHRVLY